MARVKGSQKTGGRQKGTPNKKTMALKEYLDAINFNIPDKIVKLFPKLDDNKKIDVLMKLMDYLYPKRKAIEASESSEPVTIRLTYNLDKLKSSST